jgi:hypothetical protein
MPDNKTAAMLVASHLFRPIPLDEKITAARQHGHRSTSRSDQPVTHPPST